MVMLQYRPPGIKVLGECAHSAKPVEHMRGVWRKHSSQASCLPMHRILLDYECFNNWLEVMHVHLLKLSWVWKIVPVRHRCVKKYESSTRSLLSISIHLWEGDGEGEGERERWFNSSQHCQANQWRRWGLYSHLMKCVIELTCKNTGHNLGEINKLLPVFTIDVFNWGE